MGIICESASRFPAAGNFAANFFAAKEEFCNFCPKPADFYSPAGNRAGIYGNFRPYLFCPRDLARPSRSGCDQEQRFTRKFCSLLYAWVAATSYRLGGHSQKPVTMSPPRGRHFGVGAGRLRPRVSPEKNEPAWLRPQVILNNAVNGL